MSDLSLSSSVPVPLSAYSCNEAVSTASCAEVENKSSSIVHQLSSQLAGGARLSIARRNTGAVVVGQGVGSSVSEMLRTVSQKVLSGGNALTALLFSQKSKCEQDCQGGSSADKSADAACGLSDLARNEDRQLGQRASVLFTEAQKLTDDIELLIDIDCKYNCEIIISDVNAQEYLDYVCDYTDSLYIESAIINQIEINLLKLKYHIEEDKRKYLNAAIKQISIKMDEFFSELYSRNKAASQESDVKDAVNGIHSLSVGMKKVICNNLSVVSTVLDSHKSLVYKTIIDFKRCHALIKENIEYLRKYG